MWVFILRVNLYVQLLSEQSGRGDLNVATLGSKGLKKRTNTRAWQASLMDASLQGLCNGDTDFQIASIWEPVGEHLVNFQLEKILPRLDRLFSH